MFICPVQSPCKFTQKFAARPNVYGSGGHSGLDYSVWDKSKPVPIVSPFDAVVHKVIYWDGKRRDYGNHVILWSRPHKGKIREVLLAHLERIDVKEGDEVDVGQQIGLMGNTGFSTAKHVHVSMRYRSRNGVSVLNRDNGHDGYVDFEKFVLFWSDDPMMVAYEPEHIV